jgi:transcriptional regulator GlxA family with amidase domain
MQVSVFVPQYGVIEAITPPFRTFHTANEFLTAFGKKPIFKVEYVGLNEYVPANNGEYTVKTDRLLKDVSLYGPADNTTCFRKHGYGIRANAEAIPYFKTLHQNGASLASLCIGAFLLAETGLLEWKEVFYPLGTHHRVQREISTDRS